MIESAASSLFRFNFELEPIDDIPPWGEGDSRTLHWFGLTLGHYWVSTPLGDVLRYTDEQVREWEDQSPYVDYQVARIFEDLQCVLPSALEPVPEEIAALIEEGGWVDTVSHRLKFLDDTDEQNRLYESFWMRLSGTVIGPSIRHTWLEARTSASAGSWVMSTSAGGVRRRDGACLEGNSSSRHNSLNLRHIHFSTTYSLKQANEWGE